MLLNTRTLKNYPDDALFKNVRVTYAFAGDRLVWTRWLQPITKAEILRERKASALYDRTGLRWDGDPV